MPIKIRADFNGLRGDLLCLSHSDSAPDESGTMIELTEGLIVIAFDEDADDGGRGVFLVAQGRTVPSPQSLQHVGSRWCLQVDERGVRHAATLDEV